MEDTKNLQMVYGLEVTSNRGQSLALGNRLGLVVSMATVKGLPSVKDSFLSPTQQEDARTSK
ncbi:ribosomal protein S10 [Trifolium pratense]|uniref:Ribosomal protein S10 n=1 Tax=Trifolium pratense TaxID=57577 RepID=A0A2K3M9B9_TRIPR|nr:ribosomal protein S10 [Trifolium pratense]